MIRVLLFSMLIAGQAFGCVCGTFRTPKEEWQQSAAVFLGTIETVKTLGNPMNPFAAQQIGVRVEEGFKGARARQLITPEKEGGDCSPAFSKGWRRLFYVSENGGKLYAAEACGRSSVPESAADDLKFLRALPGSAERTRISGEVRLGGPTQRGIAGVRVTVARGSDPPQTLFTDAQGVFEIYDLPMGTYAVSIEFPDARRLDYDYTSGARKSAHELPLTVELGKTDATAVFVIR